MATTLDNRHTIALPYWARPGFMLDRAPAGGGGNDDENDDDENDDEDDDEEDDPDEGKTPEELRAELVALRTANSKSKKDATRNRARRKELEQELAKAKAAPEGEPGKPEAGKYDQAALDKAVERAKKAGFDEATSTANKRIMVSEARSALVAKGASPDKVKKLTALIDFDDLEIDDEGVIGLDDAVDELVSDWPELFAKRKVSKIGGKADRDQDDRKRPMSATDRQVADLARARR